MFAVCWSVKGGSGTTVVAASLALVLARRSTPGALLVDLAGDLPAALGLPDPDGPGLAGWFAAGRSVPADGLNRLEVRRHRPPAPGPAGTGTARAGRPGRGAGRGAGGRGPVGRGRCRCALVGRSPDADPAAAVLAAAATTSLLVTRACYLSLRRAVAAPMRPTGIVVVVEPGRALDRHDVEQVVGAPVVAEVAVEPAVARAVDAGLLATRLPRSLERALGRAA